MATATIKIAIEAQTAMLQKGFGEAKQAINNLEGSMAKNVAGGMAIFTAGLVAVQGALATVQGAISSVKQAFDEMDQVADTAARLGTSSDALVALGYAAQMSGSSAETLNGALEKMQNLIGEAANGSDTAAKAFAQLGLSVDDLKGLSADQAFAAISEQMQHVGSATDRTKIAIDIFGKSGGELVQLLGQGSEGLNAMGKEAEGLGLLMGDAREGVSSVNDSLDKMKMAWRAFVQQIAVLVAPAITAVANALATVVGWFNKLMGRGTGAEAPFKAYETSAKKAAITIDETMKATEKSAEKSAEKIKETWRDIPKPQEWETPAIGAITRNSAAGFSAVQAATRDRQDRERYHREMLIYLARVEAAVLKSGIEAVPVMI
jgi:ABC-type transporter Mla subunit MlaD